VQSRSQRAVIEIMRALVSVPVDAQARRVLVVDDEAAMRAALRRVFASGDYRVELFESGTALLETADLESPGCILLDMQMPVMDGLDVQKALLGRKVVLPLVFLTGSAAIRQAVEAMRSGAVDFIEKPFDNDDLLLRVGRALETYMLEREAQRSAAATAERLQRLTPRETEVLGLIAQGMTNKEVARALGTSYRTVEIQRAHIMERMQAASLADLMRMYLSVHGERQ
jgi:two-component system, LuxR family, response regulator FixJ